MRRGVEVSRQQNVFVGSRPANSSVRAGRASSGGESVMYGHHGRRASEWTRKPLSSPLESIRPRTAHKLRSAAPFTARWAEVRAGARCLSIPASLCNAPACSRSKQATGESVGLCRALHVTQTRHQRASQRCTRKLLADSVCSVLPKEVWASTSATGVQRSTGPIRQSACHARGQ